MFKGKGKIVNAVKRAGLIATTLYYGGGQTLVAKAGEFDWITQSSGSSLDGVVNTVKKEGAGVYSLLMVIGIIGVICSLIVVGMSMAWNKNANKRDENKSQLVYIAIGSLFVFGAVSIAGGLKTIGSGFTF